MGAPHAAGGGALSRKVLRKAPESACCYFFDGHFASGPPTLLFLAQNDSAIRQMQPHPIDKQQTSAPPSGGVNLSAIEDINPDGSHPFGVERLMG